MWSMNIFIHSYTSHTHTHTRSSKKDDNMALFGAFDGFDKGSSGRRGKRKKNQHSDSEFRARMDDPRAHAAHKAALKPKLNRVAILSCQNFL